MQNNSPWRILVANPVTETAENLRKILTQTNGPLPSPNLPFEVHGLIDAQAPHEPIAHGMIAGSPYALAFLDIDAADISTNLQTISKILVADPDVAVVVCTSRPEILKSEILPATGCADRLWLLKKPLDPDQTRQLAAAVCRTIQITWDTRTKLSQLEDRFSLAVSGSNDGIWDWNVETGVVFYSTRWKEMLGYKDNEIGAGLDEWLSRVHPADLPGMKAELDAHLEGRSDKFRYEYRLQNKNGNYHWVLTRGVAIRDAAGKVRRAAGSQTEITDRKLAEEQLRHDALHDALTGLANRPLLMDRMSQCLQRAKRTPGYLFAALFLDVDRFKVINDSLGHDAGDQLLVEIATKIMTIVRGMDTVARVEVDHLARLGGDEFVLLLDPIKNSEDAVRVAERLLQALGEPFRFGRHEVYTSVSMGIAFGNSLTQRPEDVLRDADAALHHAKNDHKQRYRIYNPEMHAWAMKRLSMEGELRQAIDRGELELQYQPIHSLTTGKIVEFEALVRWQHPQSGKIQPLEFIGLAEETGLIIPLGIWVLRTACQQLTKWDIQAPGMRDIGIGVNVSGRQFAHPELVAEVRTVLQNTKLDPRRLSLEITESAIMESGPPMMNILPALHALGIRLHLDDFGTGYSSLGYLYQMPIDVLKIDRSFVNRICSGKTGRSLVQAIIAMANSLKMQVIAEGVENEPQLSILTGMGCDCVQGYYYSPALSADAALDYWKRTTGSLPVPLDDAVPETTPSARSVAS
jgi:diguanylate cyclase (GGDEF)-like protein/PAS domain S-box-containing protein